MIVLISGFRLNQTTYIEHCLTPLIGDLLTSQLLEDAVLYQDKAPCHAGQKPLTFLKKTLPSFVHAERVPPSSPYVKQQLNRVKNIKNFDDLKAALMKIWSDMPVRVARDGCTE